MTELKPIRSNDDYEEALELLSTLWGAKSGTPEGDKLDILATLLDAYETEHFPMDKPSPEAMAAFRAEQSNTGESSSAMSNGEHVFQVIMDKNGGFFYRFISPNGATILESEIFNSKAAALRAIESLKASVPGSKVFDQAA
ncbi:DUF1508 domain-containing protein [Rhizobium mayense]|uniref:DUF1508 domain-containing protein n=1 Tax=Rhizobium mayense TaxID=1312184 RepID=A0ABT7JVT1_9HYPH|nr:DUF1508 domain-containing protein [Rhizobium mayense]MDL2400452.1 DUF1508 domain-containing protein [Rhizobium mayense]